MQEDLMDDGVECGVRIEDGKITDISISAEEAQRIGAVEVQSEQPLEQTPYILPHSTKGDRTWLLCSVVLEWMREHGNAELRKKARVIQRDWDREQGWIIAWGVASGFFNLVFNAQVNPTAFEDMKALVQSEGPTVDRIIHLVELALERVREEEQRKASQPSPQPNRKKKPRVKVIQLGKYQKQPGLSGVKPSKRA